MDARPDQAAPVAGHVKNKSLIDLDGRLLIFLKYPAAGRVKTRLAKTIGDEAATDLYRCFIADTLNTARKSGYPVNVFYDPPDAGQQIKNLVGEKVTCFPQTGADLGARMLAAFKESFRNCTRAVLVGSDCPDLPADFLHDAFDSLKTHEAVIGPSEDGGYYLIGFSSAALTKDVFHGIPWGSGTVFSETMAVLLREKRMRIKVLSTWRDIDEYADLKSFAERHLSSQHRRLSAVDYLREHRLF